MNNATILTAEEIEKGLEIFKQISSHCAVIQRSVTLLELYASHGDLPKARQLSEAIRTRIETVNLLIKQQEENYVKEEGKQALQ